jgi:hypothetical protein
LVAGASDRRQHQTLLIVVYMALDKLGCMHGSTKGKWEINDHCGNRS